MNIKLKRTARTAQSEEILIFDAGSPDANNQPANIGKLDVHYLEDQVVGTLLIWQEYATGFNRVHGPGSEVTMDTLIDEILTEVTEPTGVAGEYGIEVYFPSIQNYQFISNYGGEESASELEDEDEEGDPEKEVAENGDSFVSQLRSRP
ncbi:MAG: hypothetical protein M3014_09520 [Chloroflexota bacterium]|nr:hypothetical protein [Chloroflexota bacterium]